MAQNLEEQSKEEKPEEKMIERISSPSKEEIDLPIPNEFTEVDYHPFQIDFTNRKIRMIPTSPIATSTRKFMKLHPDFLISGVIEADSTVTTVSSSASETNLDTYTIPLNSISRNDSVTETAGNVIRISASGTYSTANATDTVTIRVGNGSAPTTEWNSMISTAASVTTQPWNLVWTGIFSAIGSSGTLEAQMTGRINNVNKDDPNTATLTVSTVANIVLAITAQWSNALSGNTISIRQFLIELLN